MIKLFPKKLESYSFLTNCPYKDIKEPKLEAKPGESVLRFNYSNERDVFKAINSLPKAPKSLLFTHTVYRSGMWDSFVSQRIDIKGKKNYELETTETFIDGPVDIPGKRESKKVDYFSGISKKSVIKKIIKSKVRLNDVAFNNPNINSQIKSFEVII